MNKINYNKVMEDMIKNLEGEKKKLLLQVCCGPCSSAVIERLKDYFYIDLYYYNPMIYPRSELDKREYNIRKLARSLDFKGEIIVAENNPKDFSKVSKKRSKDREFGLACYDCYKLRMEETARFASENSYDYFTTTLSISPYKNARWINEIGESLQSKYPISYLYADFKKKDGYKKSIDLSRKYDIYRQDYCGCIYSLRESKERLKTC